MVLAELEESVNHKRCKDFEALFHASVRIAFFETGWENFPKPLNYVCDETANRKAGIVQAGHL
ncbi:hypothetical protein T02_5925 [Trichinella nativa]|uniref:Uncharacterized protein n=1 Tax=Trichinella nativa TaxID=6335 RepID=A0A0V1KWU4_9BILA|nr:hypothetical protein T06_4089 [Trichinella sp. T6]KRZ51461.1 hypothetical protein T02_5925 [Trichinella nativa]